ncbi:bacillithiol biosynthesis deacetylase BshB1 [Nemorincola caseinilytica]|uniref:Bacillithiol biosynthesis deacetylase BshB1 n=1 Tax=Nemorincola caseinilytica TaxID=2054315 RepID=A0ABP8NQF9_9BACT
MKDIKLHILAIAAHPDDLELGCGGTLIKHAQAGQAIGIVDLTEGELGTRGSVAQRYEEAAHAAKVMGVAVRENARMADGFFVNDEAHQRRLITYIRRFRPEIVIANSLSDRHPDHGKGGKLIADACFLAGLARIETMHEGEAQKPWRPKRVFHIIQDRMLEPTFLVDISDTFEQKMEAIKCYTSQFHDPASTEPATYISTGRFLDDLRSRDALMGKRIGTRYAEGFVCENIPGIASLDALILPEMA